MEFGVADPDHVAPPQFRGGCNGFTLQGHREVFGTRVDVELARLRFVADESAERSRSGPQRLSVGVIGGALRRVEPRSETLEDIFLRMTDGQVGNDDLADAA